MAIAAPIDFATVRKAIVDFAKSSMGLSDVAWEDQEFPKETYPYGTVKMISGPTKLFGEDEHRYSYDGGQPAGEEVGIEVAGLREITVSFQAYALRQSPQGNLGVEDYLARAQSALSMPSFQEDLMAAGLSVIEEMAIRNLAFTDSQTWIARAAMDVRFGLVASVTERTGYIEKLEITPDYTRPDGSEVDPDLRTTLEVGG